MSVSTKEKVTKAKFEALKNKDKSRNEAIIALLSVIKQYEIDNRTDATDEVLYPLFQKMIAKRTESIVQFTKGSRNDLIEKEKYEISVIEEFMPEAPPKPEQLTEIELDALINSVIKESGATSQKDMKTVMSLVKEKVEGKADMQLVSKKVKEFLSAL